MPNKITIRFFSTLKNITGQDRVEIEVDEAENLRDLLIQVQNDHFLPNNARLLKDGNTELETGTLCLIDDVDLNICGGLKQKFKKPVTITLISSLHGG